MPNILLPAPIALAEEAAEPVLYSAFGLTIRSELPLPEFSKVPGEQTKCSDVRVSFVENAPWSAAVRDLESSWKVDSRDSRFWIRDVGAFQVINGCEILIAPEFRADNNLLRMYVEGMMMATLLFQRGYFVLHASVVRIGAVCVGFLGHVGAGKSSTAAALHTRGHAVVTDDNAAINLATDLPQVTPAFPYVKVFPAIAESLGYPDDSLTRMHFSQPKVVREVTRGFPDAPLPLDRIYVLTRDAEPTMQRLARPEASIELVRNSVPTRWRLPGGACHLHQCTQLAARVPVFRIRTFDTLPDLPKLAERIENHHA